MNGEFPIFPVFQYSSYPCFRWRKRFTIMKVVIKKEACIGCEICVNTCPEVFMEWGLYMRPVFEVKEPERCKALIEKAVEDCPARAISVDMGELQTGGAKG